MAKYETSMKRGPQERDETAPEFSRRIQDNMDADSWQGVDRVGADFPEPAEVI